LKLCHRGGLESCYIVGTLREMANHGEDETWRTCHVPPQELHQVEVVVLQQVNEYLFTMTLQYLTEG
jgi:hypothetical protein